MDLRIYYQKLRELESKLGEEFPIVVSLETGNGGKEGICSEVPRRLAAKMMIEGAARLATAEETKKHRDDADEARKAAEQAAAAARVQLTVLSASDLDRLKGRSQPSKG